MQRIIDPTIAELNKAKDLISQKRYRNALQLINAALPHTTIPIYAEKLLVVVYTKLHCWNDVIVIADQILASDPTDSLIWFRKGWAFRKLKHYQHAIDSYKHAADAAPEISDTWYNLGKIYLLLRQYHEALTAFEAFTILKPQDAKGWVCKGSSLSKLERYQESIEAYRIASTLKLTFLPRGIRTIGRLYLRLGCGFANWLLKRKYGSQ